MSNILGVSAFYHDSACCVLQDGQLIAAAQEERFSRRKHDASLPVQAITWCLEQAGVTLADVDTLAYYEDPRVKLERQLWQRWPRLSRDSCMQCWTSARQPIEAIRRRLGYEGEIEICTHHHAHAASAFLFSGFAEAAVLTVDGVGEWATTTYGHGRAGRVELFEEVAFPHSLGLLYSTLTSYLGFAVNEGEHKVMGLAPYGRPTFVETLRKLIHVSSAGQFELDSRYFDFSRSDRMYTDQLIELIGHPPRRRGEPLLDVHQDLARSLQVVLEEVLLEKIHFLHARVPVGDLCLAGGVALNCVANGRLLREGPFKRLFVQPAAGDAGGAIGAAALAHVRRNGATEPRERLGHVYLGPSYDSDEIVDVLASLGISAHDCRGRESTLIAHAADALSRGQIIGWFQGRMEFGPRALGARSILADPREPTMRDRVNTLIKNREGFRPFAPAVIASAASDHFDLDHASPFMLETCQVTSTIPLPAITHVDNSARVQTVEPRTHPRFAALLEAFAERTGCPILLNTSFNLSDEPIVARPVDALVSFARSQLDALALEDFFIERASLPPALVANCREQARVFIGPDSEDQTYTF